MRPPPLPKVSPKNKFNNRAQNIISKNKFKNKAQNVSLSNKFKNKVQTASHKYNTQNIESRIRGPK